MTILGYLMVLIASEGFSFDGVAILTKQGTCDYLKTSKAGASKYDSRYSITWNV